MSVVLLLTSLSSAFSDMMMLVSCILLLNSLSYSLYRLNVLGLYSFVDINVNFLSRNKKFQLQSGWLYDVLTVTLGVFLTNKLW